MHPYSRSGGWWSLPGQAEGEPIGGPVVEASTTPAVSPKSSAALIAVRPSIVRSPGGPAD